MALARSVAALIAAAAATAPLHICACAQSEGPVVAPLAIEGDNLRDSTRSEILAADSEASCGAVSALQRDAGRRAGAAGTVVAAGAVDAGAGSAAAQSMGEQAKSGAAASAVAEAVSRRFALSAEAKTRVQGEVLNFLLSILKNEGLPAEDPFWEQSKAGFKDIIGSDPDTKEWIDYDANKDYVSFNKKSCDPKAAGSATDKKDDGTEIAVDAWYCGRPDLNWTSAGGKPYADLCSAKVGTAKDADGICGSVGNKQLLINLIHRGPLQWLEHPLINVPSLDCLLDIGDGDIYYCQNCAGRCGPE